MTTVHQHRVSIGLPIYNASRFVGESIESLLSQTFQDFELIISDNASTDDTQEICRNYAKTDSRIRYVRQEVNHGSTWNFNETFRLATGEYFKWAAYDDLCAPTYLAQCVKVLDEQAEVVWVHSQSRHINDSGDLLLGEKTPIVSYVDASNAASTFKGLVTRAANKPADRYAAVLLGKGGCLDAYGLARASVMRQSVLLLPYFGSEKVLMAQFGLWGKYCEIPETLFFARVHAAALGNQRTEQLQRRAINPLARGRQYPRLGLLAGYFSALRGAPISATERARCLIAISRYVMQVQKWREVLKKTLSGGGLAGEYPALRPATGVASGH